MRNHNGLPIFFAGLGIGVAAALVWMDEDVRSRVGKVLGKGSDRVSDALSDSKATWNRGAKALNEATEQLKSKIDDAAEATKKMVDQATRQTRDAAHRAGEQLERGGKRLRQA